MTALPVTGVSPAEYLRRERLAEFRSEYNGGEIVALAGASRGHNRIVMNITASLHAQLRDRPCGIYANDMRVSVRGGERYYYPDIVVTCGEQVFEDGEQDSLVNPFVIMEVLSPSTERSDRGDKFHDDRSIPSLREYVLVSQPPRYLEIFRKQRDGMWLYRSSPSSPPPLLLSSIDCTLTPDEVYHQVEEEGE